MLVYTGQVLISPFKTCVPFSGTRLNDHLRGVACARVFHGIYERVQTHSVELIASPRRTRSYSEWNCRVLLDLAHTHSLRGVLVLFHWGFWPFPACPRTYLRTSLIKARPFPPARCLARLPRYYRPLGLPPGSGRLQPSGFYAQSLADVYCWLRSRISPVPPGLLILRSARSDLSLLLESCTMRAIVAGAL